MKVVLENFSLTRQFLSLFVWDYCKKGQRIFYLCYGGYPKNFKNFFSEPPSEKNFSEIFLKIFFGQSIALKKLGTVPKGLTDWCSSRWDRGNQNFSFLAFFSFIQLWSRLSREQSLLKRSREQSLLKRTKPLKMFYKYAVYKYASNNAWATVREQLCISNGAWATMREQQCVSNCAWATMH